MILIRGDEVLYHNHPIDSWCSRHRYDSLYKTWQAEIDILIRVCEIDQEELDDDFI